VVVDVTYAAGLLSVTAVGWNFEMSFGCLVHKALDGEVWVSIRRSMVS
jgi:hypothetical protein